MTELYLEEMLIKGCAESPVAIVTLWSNASKMAAKLKKFRLAGQLYTNTGISTLVRNCLLDKGIRYLIVTGSDISSSGSSLINLKLNGIDNRNRIIGSEKIAVIDSSIPKEAVERFRKNVVIVDMRGIDDPDAINAKILSLPYKLPYGKPEVFPEPQPKQMLKWPAESSGHIARARNISQAWLELMDNVMKFGTVKESQYGCRQKELLNLIAVVEGEDPDKPKWESYYTFTRKQLKEYLPKMLTAGKIGGVSYTYGKRLMDFKGIDQIEAMAEKLKRTAHTRRAVSVIWDVKEDGHSDNPPCFTLLQAVVQEGKLYLTAYFRSNDMFAAWPMNAYALLMLQKSLCLKTGYEMASLTTIACSAHIYESDWIKAKEIVKENPVNCFEEDPRGNFVIYIKDKRIMANMKPSLF